MSAGYLSCRRWKMSLLTLGLVSCILFQYTANASRGYDYGFDLHSLAKRQYRDRPPHLVRGFLDQVVPRREVRDLQSDPNAWTLYILALDSLQWRDQSSSLSFYQIAGIHAVPWETYNNVPQSSDETRSGFCHHNSVLFPTWHRAYMSFFEQVLYQETQLIASLYDENRGPRMQEVARRFRLPYWDWASNPEVSDGHVLPVSLGQATVEVDGPNGVQRIANPLFAYIFHPLIERDFPDAPFNRCEITKRVDNKALEGNSDNDKVRARLDSGLPSIQQRLYALFSNYQNYTMFSNADWSHSVGNGSYDSVEAIHDTIHASAGLQGHMAWTWYSAFDPIFFLHHANVDRVFALWQALYPESWIEPYPARYSTWTGNAGDMQSSTTPLSPFWSHGNIPTTSDDIRDISILGYTYPELVEVQSHHQNSTKPSRREKLVKIISEMYGSSSPSQLKSARQPRSGRERNKEMFNKSFRQGTSPVPGLSWNVRTSTPPPDGSVLVDGKYREWLINIHVNKHALQSSFSIPFFLGDVGRHESKWFLSSNHVGTASFFSGKGPIHSRVYVSTTVPLTSALIQMIVDGRLASLQPADVERLVRRKLRFRVLQADTVEVDAERIDGLSIILASAVVTLPCDEGQLPIWGPITAHLTLF